MITFEALVGKKISKVNKKRKRLFVNKFGHVCQYCKNEFAFDELTIEHIVPKWKGGSDKKDNLTVVCKDCNHRANEYEMTRHMYEEFDCETVKILIKLIIEQSNFFHYKGSCIEKNRVLLWEDCEIYSYSKYLILDDLRVRKVDVINLYNGLTKEKTGVWKKHQGFMKRNPVLLKNAIIQTSDGFIGPSYKVDWQTVEKYKLLSRNTFFRQRCEKD